MCGKKESKKKKVYEWMQLLEKVYSISTTLIDVVRRQSLTQQNKKIIIDSTHKRDFYLYFWYVIYTKNITYTRIAKRYCYYKTNVKISLKNLLCKSTEKMTNAPLMCRKIHLITIHSSHEVDMKMNLYM